LIHIEHTIQLRLQLRSPDIPPDIEPQTFRYTYIKRNTTKSKPIRHSKTRIDNHTRAEVRALEFSHLPPAVWETLRIELR
jgi:hypothetical protein